jgi:GDPmannose 4,6-dehydratase
MRLLEQMIKDIQPDECYHLAASSFVSFSFEDELSVLSNNVTSTHHLLAAIKEYSAHCKFFLAGSSEMFGNAASTPQDETTPFNPRSIYGISKVTSHYLSKHYRDQHDLFTSTGILYNHESPRRGMNFVTRKIISSAVRIKLGLQDNLVLGDVDALRDWGYAPDYVQAMWLMLQQGQPDDYVVATGETHSVREFLEIAFSELGLNYRKYLQIDPQFIRPREAVLLCGNPAKAMNQLHWSRSAGLRDIIRTMIENETPA